MKGAPCCPRTQQREVTGCWASQIPTDSSSYLLYIDCSFSELARSLCYCGHLNVMLLVGVCVCVVFLTPCKNISCNLCTDVEAERQIVASHQSLHQAGDDGDCHPVCSNTLFPFDSHSAFIILTMYSLQWLFVQKTPLQHV